MCFPSVSCKRSQEERCVEAITRGLQLFWRRGRGDGGGGSRRGEFESGEKMMPQENWRAEMGLFQAMQQSPVATSNKKFSVAHINRAAIAVEWLDTGGGRWTAGMQQEKKRGGTEQPYLSKLFGSSRRSRRFEMLPRGKQTQISRDG